MEAETKTRKAPGRKKPGVCTVQSLELVSGMLAELTAKLDARTSHVVAAAVAMFSQLDTPEQVQRIQDVRVAYANSLNG